MIQPCFQTINLSGQMQSDKKGVKLLVMKEEAENIISASGLWHFNG